MSSGAGGKEKLAWGILGCASVARQVTIPGIRNSRNGTALAIASRSLAKAEEFGRKLGIERTYGSYEELLDDPDVTAVYIPLANSLHKEWTIRAAEKSKHVLCEKPLSVNAVEAEEMRKACRQSGVILMEVFAHRFHPQNLRVKELIDEGRIGRLLHFSSFHASGPPPAGDIRLSKDLAGGVLMDKGCYCLNIARFFFGSEPVSVYATAEFGEESGVDERVVVTLEFPEGKVAHFESSFRLKEGSYTQGYDVFGTQGHIQVPQGFSQIETYRRGTLVDTRFSVGDIAVLEPKQETFVCEGVHIWQLQAEYFADRVLNGEEISFPAEDGLANMKAIDAIYRSAREKAIVTL